MQMTISAKERKIFNEYMKEVIAKYFGDGKYTKITPNIKLFFNAPVVDFFESGGKKASTLFIYEIAKIVCHGDFKRMGNGSIALSRVFSIPKMREARIYTINLDHPEEQMLAEVLDYFYDFYHKEPEVAKEEIKTAALPVEEVPIAQDATATHLQEPVSSSPIKARSNEILINCVINMQHKFVSSGADEVAMYAGAKFNVNSMLYKLTTTLLATNNYQECADILKEHFDTYDNNGLTLPFVTPPVAYPADGLGKIIVNGTVITDGVEHIIYECLMPWIQFAYYYDSVDMEIPIAVSDNLNIECGAIARVAKNQIIKNSHRLPPFLQELFKGHQPTGNPIQMWFNMVNGGSIVKDRNKYGILVNQKSKGATYDLVTNNDVSSYSASVYDFIDRLWAIYPGQDAQKAHEKNSAYTFKVDAVAPNSNAGDNTTQNEIAKLSYLVDGLARAQSELSALRFKVNELTSERDSLLCANSDLKHQVAKLVADVNSRNMEIRDANAKYSAMKIQLNEANKTIEKFNRLRAALEAVRL